MPIVATLYHHGNRTAPPFVVSTPYGVRYKFVEPMALGCSGDVPKARDITLPGAAITTGAKGSTSVALASIAGTGCKVCTAAQPYNST